MLMAGSGGDFFLAAMTPVTQKDASSPSFGGRLASIALSSMPGGIVLADNAAADV
jgi:hypothetical protein